MEYQKFLKEIDGKYKVLVSEEKFEKNFGLASSSTEDVDTIIASLIESKKLEKVEINLLHQDFDIDDKTNTPTKKDIKPNRAAIKPPSAPKRPNKIIKPKKGSNALGKTYTLHREFQEALTKISDYNGLGGASEAIRYLTDYYLNSLSAAERKSCLEGHKVDTW